MKTIFKAFGLKEDQIIREVSLSCNGITNKKEFIVTRHHQDDFDNEFDAINFISQTDAKFEHGFEIVKTFTKK